MGAEDVGLPRGQPGHPQLHNRQAAREQLTGVSIEEDREIAISIQVPAAARSELRDEAELSGFSEVLKDQAYQATQGGLELESFFQDNEEIYQVLAKDYLEYSVDMSINPLTVHMCGHSQHLADFQPIFDSITSNFV